MHLFYLWRIDERTRCTCILLPAVDHLNAVWLCDIVKNPLVKLSALYLFSTLINHTSVVQLFVATSYKDECCEEGYKYLLHICLITFLCQL